MLAAICNQHPKGQLLCAQSGLLQVCMAQLPAALAALATAADADFAAGAAGGSAKSMALFVRWLLLCIGKQCENAPEVTAMALREQVRAAPAGCWVAWPLASLGTRRRGVLARPALTLPGPPPPSFSSLPSVFRCTSCSPSCWVQTIPTYEPQRSSP